VSSRSTALLLLLTSTTALTAVACGGGDSVTGGGGGGSASIASVSVSPALDTAVSIDETVAFSAAAHDAGGSSVSGASFSWSSTDEGVATVSSSGQATARANGTAKIVATAGGEADTATLVVEQRPDTVVVSPDSARLSLPGDTMRFTASVDDANGHEMLGVPVEWGVSDSSVATIDSAGLVTAVQTGRVSVIASAATAGVSGAAALRVSSTVPPAITSVSPSPLREGGSATITGQDFDPGAAGDTVLVDGIRATVTSASSTSLQITVPTYDCLPARSVTVRLATDGGVAQSSSSLDPALAPVSLEVGQQTVLTDPADYCLQFEATAATERYVMGVQSLAQSASLLTPVQITGEAANGLGAASAAPTAKALVASPRRDGGAVPRTPSWLDGQRRAEARLREWERTHLDPATSIPATRGAAGAPAPRLSVSGTAVVGDTVSLRVPDAGSNGCSSYTSVGATVRAIGQEAIVVADTGNPANGFTQADYQSLSDQLDDQIFSTDVDYFGDPGDIDGNGHIVVLFTKAVNAMSAGTPNSTLLGFVFSGDWQPRTSCASSDEGEIYYGRVPDPDSTFGTASKRENELSRAPQIMAHELTHLIQFGRRFALGLGFMGSVVAEGQATFGEEVVGHAVNMNQPYQNYGADVMFGRTGADSVPWYLNKFTDLAIYFGFAGQNSRVGSAPEQCGWWQQDPSPCQGRSLWYGVSWSFLRWVSDRYGPDYGPGGVDGEKTLQQDLIADPNAYTRPQAVSDVVGVPLDSLLARWSAALYVDDRVPSADPSLRFTSWNLFDFEQHTVSTAHLLPEEESFADWTFSPDIRASSTAYVAVDGTGRPATAVKFRNAAGAPLSSYMQVWVVRVQ